MHAVMGWTNGEKAQKGQWGLYGERKEEGVYEVDVRNRFQES